VRGANHESFYHSVYSRLICLYLSWRHEHVSMLNLLCLFLGQRTVKCRMIQKMTQFSWLSVYQTLWQCAILNQLLCNICLRHWLRQYLYSDMDSADDCQHSKDKICILVIFRGAIHRTQFNRFRCCCLMCNHVFLFSSKQLRGTSDIWWLVVSHSSKKRRAQLKDNGQL
jgi:hypothetical protein